MKILRAGYGYVNQVIDVTDKVQQAVDSGKRTIAATDEWGDPAFGSRKALFIVWTAGDGDDTPRLGVTSQDQPAIVLN